jgi:hypothetical protein
MREQQENRIVIPGKEELLLLRRGAHSGAGDQGASYSKDRAPVLKWPGSEAINS